MTRGRRRQYDHRIRQAVVATRNVRLFPDLEIPVSTARTWLTRGCPRVVAANDDPSDAVALRAEIAVLRAKAEMYLAISSVLLVIIRMFGLSLDATRLPEGTDKAKLVRAIKMASQHAPLRRILSLIGLSPSRYHAWKRRKLVCELDDQPSCPRSQPTQLTAAEVQAIKGHVLNPEFRHMTVRALSLHAQRLGEVFASESTWRRLIHSRGWKRPRVRVYLAKPKTGVRATRPNEWWHIDLTVVRLTNGAKVYLHAVIDNFSRKILGWELAESVAGKTTTTVLETAAKYLGTTEVSLMADSGAENVNEEVDGYLEGSVLKRVLAQVEVSESNSMIEAFWRSLRHQWLYLHDLDCVEALRPLVDFYVTQHNTVMPHAAFDGQTPDEMFHGISEVAPNLSERRRTARRKRIEINRSRSCGACADDDFLSDSKGVANEAA
jgi:transposase InsO family protein